MYSITEALFHSYFWRITIFNHVVKWFYVVNNISQLACSLKQPSLSWEVMKTPTSILPEGDQTCGHWQSSLGHRSWVFQRLHTSWTQKKITGPQNTFHSSCKYTVLNVHPTFTPTFSWLGKVSSQYVKNILKGKENYLSLSKKQYNLNILKTRLHPIVFRMMFYVLFWFLLIFYLLICNVVIDCEQKGTYISNHNTNPSSPV